MERKPLFDLLRRLLGRGFSQSEVRAIDAVLDDFAPTPSASDPICLASPVAVQLIKQFEGCARLRPDGMYEAYPDPGTNSDPWTIGWGATGQDVGPGTVWTGAQCDARLEADIARHADEVRAALHGAPTTQPQFDALVSFHFNTGAIARATLTRLHRQGKHEAAANEFARWKFAGGRVMRGLVRRRREEARLYRSGARLF